MSAFPTTGFAFPTTGVGAFPSGAGGIGDVTEFGCPLSAFVSLESVCSATNVPSCVAAQVTGTGDPFSITYDAACCTSLRSYGESIGSCYSKHAPSCLDTSAILASATGDVAPGATDIAAVSDPCAQYFGGKAGGGGKATPAPSAGSAANGGSGGTQTGSGGSAGGQSGSASAASGSKPNAAAAGNTVGLKVWIGVVGMGALAVLAL